MVHIQANTAENARWQNTDTRTWQGLMTDGVNERHMNVGCESWLTNRPSLSIFVCAQYSRSALSTRSGFDESMSSITCPWVCKGNDRLRWRQAGKTQFRGRMCAKHAKHFCPSSHNSIAMMRATHLLNDLDADLALLFFELGIDGTACSSHHSKHHNNAHVFNQPPCVNLEILPRSVCWSLCARAETYEPMNL